MRAGTKVSKAHKGLQVNFGSETGFRFARMARGCITHGQFFKKGESYVEMDAQTFDELVSQGLVHESSRVEGCFYLIG